MKNVSHLYVMFVGGATLQQEWATKQENPSVTESEVRDFRVLP
jgi:hypothetical protein